MNDEIKQYLKNYLGDLEYWSGPRLYEKTLTTITKWYANDGKPRTVCCVHKAVRRPADRMRTSD